MLTRKHKKNRLNIDIGKSRKNPVKNLQKDNNISSDLDKLVQQSLNGSSSKSMAISSLNESNEYINEISANLFNKLGIVTVNSDISSNVTLVNRVETYLKRFPEIEYLIDMLASSIIYTSSSNTKKIQVTLNGEHKSIVKEKNVVPDPNRSDSTSSDSTSITEVEVENNQTNVDIEQITFNENVEKVDSYYRDISIEIGNLFKKNNIKLSLYNLMFSLLKFGCGIFYIDDPTRFDSVSFYGLDEVEFVKKQKKRDHADIKQQLFTDDNESELFTSTDDDDHIKKLKNAGVSVIRLHCRKRYFW
jgi:uncharacterized protein YlxP (DUF503 family)